MTVGRIRTAALIIAWLGQANCGSGNPAHAGPVKRLPTPVASSGPVGVDEAAVPTPVASFIRSTHDGKEATAAMQFAAALAHKLAQADQPLQQRLARVAEVHRATECLYHVLGPSKAESTRVEIRARLLDTEERTRAYLRSEQGMGGQTFTRRSREDLDLSCLPAGGSNKP
ncbi:MAG: hypothetical protein ACHQ53_16130 [Polyangiales bacterium]